MTNLTLPGYSDARPAAAAALRRRNAVFVVKLTVSLVLLGAVASGTDLLAAGALLAGFSPSAALAAILCLMGVTVVSALRWWLVIRTIDAPQPFRRILALMFVGSFFTQMLPTSIGGDAVRIWQLTRHGVAADRAFIGVILERVSGLVALVLMVVGGVLWLGEILPTTLRLLLLASLPGLLAALVLLCWLDRLPEGLRRMPLLGRGLRVMADMAVDARRVSLAPVLSLALLSLSAAAQVFSVLAFFFLAQGLGLALSLVETFAVVPAVILITFLPVSFAGWGVRETASILMFAAVGLGGDAALALSVLFGLALILAGLPGLPLWLRRIR